MTDYVFCVSSTVLYPNEQGGERKMDLEMEMFKHRELPYKGIGKDLVLLRKKDDCFRL